MLGTNLQDESVGTTSIPTIGLEKIFIENSQFIYSNTWKSVTDYILFNKNLYCFAEDKTYIDNKTKEQRFIYNYYAIDYNSIFKLSKQKKFHLYETYEAEQTIKLFLDIDIQNEKIPDGYKKNIVFKLYNK